MYSAEIQPSCQKDIEKLCKKNHALQDALGGKMHEIIQYPHHYKPLRHPLAGQRRVHILKSFVLKFEIDEHTQTVRFIFFGRHDDAYIHQR
ncbi:MAG TPA: type II toxin-antitoxin system RelE/ParE family toxin [Candidatus Nanoarchaeia archaeon]|nr:type II toxin-antitoxin system RelE/ParE family toxin [Candidatus Nanoarchaeia archaeon]